MTSYVFQRLARLGRAEGLDGVRQKDARTWYRNAASSIRSVNRNKLLNDPQNLVSEVDVNSIGKMYMFFYDPKYKETLPYYDTFPLVIVIGPAEKGFLGLNLHYLPQVLRAKLMNSLYDTINNTKYDDSTKLKISYSMLNSASRYRYFKPCIKHYLNEHVKSRFLEVEPRFWDAALMLPTEKFQKADIDTVWNDSRSKVV